MLNNEREKVGIDNFKNPTAFIDYTQTIGEVYENLEDYNPTKKRRVLIVFNDMIADMESNKTLSLRIVFKRKLSIACLFLYQNLISKSLKL